jgi:hypothetical protein
MQLALGSFVLVINVALYGWLLWRWRRNASGK